MRLTDRQQHFVLAACRYGATVAKVAARFGTSKSTVERVLREARARGEGVELGRGRPRKQSLHRENAHNIRSVPLSIVEEMCSKHHAFGSSGASSVYAFAVFENEVPVAAFAWQPPPYGAANTICPESPSAVLALSRMVAVPKEQRLLRHISKPLRYQMHQLIDRTRWPVLVTYSDEGLGHTGHVYKCSGWQPTKRTSRDYFLDEEGRRRSMPSQRGALSFGGKTILQCWEHRVCAPGDAADWLHCHGWRRESIPKRRWRSGNPASTWIHD